MSNGLIFMSYRRDDAAGIARAIYDHSFNISQKNAFSWMSTQLSRDCPSMKPSRKL